MDSRKCGRCTEDSMPGGQQDMLSSGLPSRESSPGRTPLTEATPHHVVIVGAGFGGLAVCHGLAGAASRRGLRITIVDQPNHHLFQPLLYQVGTAVLATSEIAWPIRHLVRRRKEVTTLLAVVNGIDA